MELLLEGYDQAGRKKFVGEPADPPLPQATQTYAGAGTQYLGFDSFGRPTSIRTADQSAGSETTLAYKGISKVSRTSRVATATGLVTAETTEFYDGLGRLWKVLEPMITAPGESKPDRTATTYRYDVAGRLIRVEHNIGKAPLRQHRSFDYDARGLLLGEFHPESGSTTYTYDAKGNVFDRTNANGTVLRHYYDGAGRLRRIAPKSAPTNGYSLKTFDYYPSGAQRGKLEKTSAFNWRKIGTGPSPVCTSFEVAEQFTYDDRGLLGRQTTALAEKPFGGSSSPHESWDFTIPTYDGAGRATKMRYPACVGGACTATQERTINFEYAFGRTSRVHQTLGPGNAFELASAFQYHPSGLLKQFLHGNGVRFEQAQDATGRVRPASMSAKLGATALWESGMYGYDPSGNIKAIGTTSYAYDALSRLTSVKIPGLAPPAPAPAVPGVTQTYEFDRLGNLVKFRRAPLNAGGSVSGPWSELLYDVNPTSNGLASGSYSRAGSLLSYPQTLALDWDAFQNMTYANTGSEQWVHNYDANNERVWSWKVSAFGSPTKIDETFTLRAPDGKALREFTKVAGALVSEDYVYRDGQLLASFKAGSAIPQHFDLDHLGSVRLVTGENGAELSEEQFLPFGERFPAAAANTEQMQFTGHERDLGAASEVDGGDDDLDYMHARYYKPIWGRFLSVDRAPGKPATPQSWNRYAYVRGNPLKFLDPNGLEELLFTIRTFIPMGSVKAPIGGVFGGDNRGFSANAGTARSTQLVRIETDPNRSANPLLSNMRSVGETHKLDASGAIIGRGTASADGLTAMGSRDGQGNAIVQVRGSADNPLVQPSAAIDYSLTITATPSGGGIVVSGTHDGFPALEVYVTNSRGQTAAVIQFDPNSVGNGLMDLFPGVGDQPVSGACSSTNTGVSCSAAQR